MKPEITVFTEGDSTDSSVWSNVPFFLTNTLMEQGYKVNRVNLYGNILLRNFYDKFICRILRHTLLKGTSFSYNRSFLYTLELQHLLKKAVKAYPNTDIFLSTTFSFTPSRYTQKPCILFCDWTYEYYVQTLLHRKGDFLEQAEIKRQTHVIESATAIFSLFPDKAELMRKRYGNPHIYYLGNVINSPVYSRNISDCTNRFKEKHILFIGMKKYITGAESLIQAIIKLHEKDNTLYLDLIGMVPQDFSFSIPDYIHCHGYLDKNSEASKEYYYSLMDNSFAYVNTTPVWAGFSSCLEAMYHYVPVITTNYDSFVETFGTTINFGYYCRENRVDLIIEYLNRLFALSKQDYIQMCQNARTAVEPFAWEQYVSKMLETVEKL